MNETKVVKQGLAGLDVFQVAVQLAEEIQALTQVSGNLKDHLARSSESVVLNISEAYPAVGNERSRKYKIAAGEASECRGALELLRIRKLISRETYERIWTLIDRLCAMLWKLSRRKQ